MATHRVTLVEGDGTGPSIKPMSEFGCERNIRHAFEYVGTSEFADAVIEKLEA
jgi:isocitrate dehydrogenase